ncbi:hypothetical protein L3Q82_018136 [Scortum barcoo]|uniref:Uncharacterized protein n=1 Tax=Scortum barcoo TaxID=214431 RepID=A0ACB8VIN6_9TELE|nr:hypothetical protein L3Q82_018136 [Scortum barcoo]
MTTAQSPVRSPLLSEGGCFDMWHDYMNLGRLLERLCGRREGARGDGEWPRTDAAGGGGGGGAKGAGGASWGHIRSSPGSRTSAEGSSASADSGSCGSSSDFCRFCKQNGESAQVYRSHRLQSDDGRVVCPILWSYTCPICEATGDRAHTRRYCPQAQRQEETEVDLPTMAKHNVIRMIAIVLALLFFIVTMVFTALAGPGIYPFLSTTANVSGDFVTQITPLGWTFTIWSIIYIFLASVLVYVLSGICRKNAYGYVYSNPAILPYGFFVTWCLNLTLNTAWLFLWDRRLMPAALAFLILIALTNYTMIFFSCLGLHNYGAWLSKYHRVDLWLHRVLIQNGIAIYATWTTIASLVNLTIVLGNDVKMSQTDAATVALSILTVVVAGWFILENFVLDKHVRYILTIYPVVIWALTGVFTKNYNAAAPTRNNTFIGITGNGNESTTMGKHNPGRVAAIVVSIVGFAISLVFNGLSVVGIGPYGTTTANVSAVFDTQITPSGWTFNIWTLIYVWLTLMVIYIAAGLCRKLNGYGYVYCSPAVLPYGFFISWCLNLCFNIGWLLVWDRGVMTAALVFLLLVICTNYSMICFVCHGLHIYGAWLNKYHKADLWLLHVLVQNGVMIYTTWTTIATLINLTIVLTYEANMSPLDAATISYSILGVVLLVWFFLENVVLDKHVRYILIIYPVVIWALSGNLDKNYDAESPNLNGIFIVVLLAIASVLFAVRIVLVVWRHFKQPLYEDIIPEAMEPAEIAEKQKKIFR